MAKIFKRTLSFPKVTGIGQDDYDKKNDKLKDQPKAQGEVISKNIYSQKSLLNPRKTAQNAKNATPAGGGYGI